MIQQKLSLFQCLTSVPSKAVGLEEVVRLIRYDSGVTGRTESYRQMARVLGKEKADEEVKRKLMPAVSVGVLFDGNGRGAANVLGFTGLALCDIDHIPTVDEAFEKLKTDPHTLLAYRTVSGEGLRAIYRYEREDVEGHIDATSWRAAFLKGNTYFAGLTGHEYDAQCGDYSRLCGLAHDAEVYVNWEAEPFVITDEEILQANFSPDTEPGKPRKEYATGSFCESVDPAWQRIQQQLAKRHLQFESHHHHDYVMHAAFLFNRYGVALDELLQWASQEWSAYDAKQREATIRSCYKKTDEHGTWKLSQPGRRKKNALASLADIGQWLKSHMQLQYNDVNDRTYYRTDDSQPWTEVDNRVICTIRKQIESDTGKRTLKSDVTDVIWSDSATLFHPIRDYILSLAPWDGQDRVGELASYVTVEPVLEGQSLQQAQQYLHWAFHKWLVAIVAAWMNDHVANHEIFTFIGPQGIFKTTFFRHLLPQPLRQYFWENPRNSFRSKDDKISLAENALVEIEEVDISNPADIAELKALASAVAINERRPYGKQRNQKHKLASLCATGNEQHFLVDETGNRRWLCFLISAISKPQEWTIDYDQLYAQLYHDYRQGFPYWFDLSDQQRVEQQNAAFRQMSDEEQLIRTHYRKPRPGDPIKLLSSAAICKWLNGGRLGYGLSSKKVGTVMKKLGFQQIHNRSGNFFKVYEIPYDQIQAQISAATDEQKPEAPAPEEAVLPF